MHTIRKIALLVSILLFSLNTASAEAVPSPGKYNLSVTALFGFLYGQSDEIVYKYSNSDLYGSELLWDIKPVFYTGIGLLLGPMDPFANHGFVSESSLKCGIPIKSGTIEDRDWLGERHEYLTHYSRHDAYSRMSLQADISAGYSWHLGRFLSLSAFGEFSYMYFSWSARDGYKQYSTSTNSSGDVLPWDSSIPKVSISGEGILYKQNWFMLSPGFSLKGRLSRLFSVEGKFSYTPLIFCADHDDHLMRVPPLVFRDYLFLGHYFQGGGKFLFSPTQSLGMHLGFSYRYITGTRGPTYEQEENGSTFKTSSNGAGVGFSAMNVELGVRMQINGRR